MSDPIVPNFNPGSGARLATDRIDFQKHVDGYSFKHIAESVTLSPNVTISSTAYTNVQDAIEALSTIVAPSFTVPDATTTSKGIVQLTTTGDVGGTATLLRVTRLQGSSVSTLPPTSGQVLTWSGVAWTPTTPSTSFTAANDLSGNNVSQVVIGIQSRQVANISPNNGNVLTWVAANNRWEPVSSSPTGTGFATITSGLFDSAATANIRYTGGKLQTDTNIQFKNTSNSILGDLTWSPTTSNKTITLPDANDTLVGLATTDTLTNKTINVNNNTLTASSTANGDLLVSNGTKFLRLAQGSNGSFLGVSGGVLGFYTPSNSTPSGTGFATITAGVYDSTATTNIRYTGGKFQTDASIQYKSGSIFGDLTWAPTTTNKTLTLPDATDTLVGQATTDTLTNKTVNVANNSVTSTSQATGDLLKNNGTKFVRFGMGSALQVLRTNSGATDLEWATVTLPATQVSLDQVGAGQLNNVVTTSGSNEVVMIRFTGDGAATDITLSGLASGSGVRRIALMPTSTSKLIISHQDVNSSSSNRIITPRGVNYIVGTDGYGVDVIWDGTTSRWRVIANVAQLSTTTT